MTRSSYAVGAVIGVLVLGFALPSNASTAALAPPAPDFADPFVVREADTYLAFATGSRGVHVQVSRSRDLTSWGALPDALPKLPSWAAKEEGYTWAPTALRREQGWVLYFTTRDAASGFQCISRATSANAAGPYSDESSRPFLCQTDLCGSIDPSPFVDARGKGWLLWKSDENSLACRGRSRIWSQPLADDGLSLRGAPSALLTTDSAWERPLIEGPSMVRSGADTYLFYSANWYESADYAIGYAKCDGPSGPCTKMSRNGPLVKSSGEMLGPGGQETFTDAAGQTWMAFHAWTAPRTSYRAGGARSLRFARLTFADGAPAVRL